MSDHRTDMCNNLSSGTAFSFLSICFCISYMATPRTFVSFEIGPVQGLKNGTRFFYSSSFPLYQPLTLFYFLSFCSVSPLLRRNPINPHFFSSWHVFMVISGGCTKGFEKLYFKVHIVVCPRNITSFLGNQKLIIIS